MSGTFAVRAGSRKAMATWGMLALAAAGASGCSRATADRPPAPTRVAVVEARTMNVPVESEPIGTTAALQEVSIRARVRGFLKEMNFKEGTDVKAGQLLFVIDEDPFKATLAQAQARLAANEAALKKAQDSKAREVAAAQIALDQATMELNKVEETRQVLLLRRNAASQQDVDQAVAKRRQSEAQVTSDTANYDQAKPDYDTNIKTAEANVAGSKAEVLNASIDLGYCRMYSPIDGRIGVAQVKLGNLVGPAPGGAEYTNLATVNQLNPMGVDIQVGSVYLDRATRLLNQGLTAEVSRKSVDADGPLWYRAKGLFINNTIDPSTSTFLARFEVDNPQATLLPGEYVRARIHVGDIPDAVVVPEQAVVETQAGSTVYTVDGEGKVAVAPVKATATYRGLRVLESGVKVGQQVIVEGIQLVRPGMKVEAKIVPSGTHQSPAPPAKSNAPPSEGPKAEPKAGSKS